MLQKVYRSRNGNVAQATSVSQTESYEIWHGNLSFPNFPTGMERSVLVADLPG